MSAGAVGCTSAVLQGAAEGRGWVGGRQVERLGFSRAAVMDGLKGRHQNKATVAYYLLLDSRRRAAGSASGAYLHAELSIECEALMQNPLGAPPPPLRSPNLPIGRTTLKKTKPNQKKRKLKVLEHAIHPSWHVPTNLGICCASLGPVGGRV